MIQLSSALSLLNLSLSHFLFLSDTYGPIWRQAMYYTEPYHIIKQSMVYDSM